MPAYNAEPYVAAAIESVLSQTHPAWDLLILDNNSSDCTGDIARSYDDPRITVHRNSTTLAQADNWNAVVALATNRYVKVLCADDLLHPECLAEEISVLAEHDDLAIVASLRHFIDASGEVILKDRGLIDLVGRHDAVSTVRTVVRSGINPIGCPSSMMFRKEVFDRTEGFRGDWQFTMDLEMALRLLEHGDFYGIDRPLTSFRISPTSASSNLANPGAQHRAMLRQVAEAPRWGIRPGDLSRGLFRSKIESVRKWMLFRSINSRHRTIRRLPAMLLSGPAQQEPRPSTSQGSAGQPTPCSGEATAAES